MALRIREVNGVIIAICAAKSIPKDGDIYIDDEQYAALMTKFADDYNSMYELGLVTEQHRINLMQIEEDNNPNRDWWNETYQK